MTDQQAERDREALYKALDDLADLLARHDAAFWSRRAAEWSHLIKARDARGVTDTRSSFGGMGSLTDVLIGGRESPAQLRLETLRNEVYELTNRLARYIAARNV
ncbi:MAG: hypothetical protein AAGD32_01775 [Planctomycetota bacterium]